jgi:hypothetical protein
MLTQRRISLAALLALALLGGAKVGRASTIDADAITFLGADRSVHIFMDDTGGNVSITLTMNDGVADLRGFFLNIDDFALLAGLQVSGDDVTDWTAKDDDVINLGGANNLQGKGSPCPCDIGVSIGTSGGNGAVSSTTFVLDADGDLTLDHFAHQLIGVRVISAGSVKEIEDLKDPKEDLKDFGRGSAKLAVELPEPTPVPEPATALLVALGTGALAYARRRS